MHIPAVFYEEDFDNIIDFIAAKPLATIIAQTNKGIEACHIPLFYYEECSDSDGKQRYLYGHFGRKNSIYLDVLPNTSWLIIIQDTGHYISPNWYPSKAKTKKEVPTWNYQSIHVQSKIEMLEDSDTLKWILETMTAQQEIVSENPWSLEDAPSAYIDAMCRGIIGFRPTIDSIQVQFKLSQNKTVENIAGVMHGLELLDTKDAAEMAVKVVNHNNRSPF